jgi:hypothetical protein
MDFGIMRCGVLCLYNFDVDRPRDDLFPTRRANPRYQSPNATSLNRPTSGDRAGSLKGRFWTRPARTQPARSRCTSAARTIAFDAYVGKLKDARPSDNIYPHFLPRDARANSRWLVQHGFAGDVAVASCSDSGRELTISIRAFVPPTVNLSPVTLAPKLNRR